MRLLLALAAAVAAVWLGLSFVSERSELQAARVAFSERGADPGQNADAMRKVRRARRLQPDTGPMLVEWALLHQRREGQGQALLREIVSREPLNAEAWRLLALSAPDPRVKREARQRFRELRRE